MDCKAECLVPRQVMEYILAGSSGPLWQVVQTCQNRANLPDDFFRELNFLPYYAPGIDWAGFWSEWAGACATCAERLRDFSTTFPDAGIVVAARLFLADLAAAAKHLAAQESYFCRDAVLLALSRWISFQRDWQ